MTDLQLQRFSPAAIITITLPFLVASYTGSKVVTPIMLTRFRCIIMIPAIIHLAVGVQVNKQLFLMVIYMDQ